MTHRANAKHKFLNHNSRYINFMQIALLAISFSPKISFQQNLGSGAIDANSN